MTEQLVLFPTGCYDCGLPYKEFGLDVILPRSQWLVVCPEENALLCAQCIINRASKIPSISVVHATLEVLPRSV